MSDLDNFVAMVERAGHGCDVQKDTVCRFTRGGRRSDGVFDMHGVTSVTVDGVFYDYLYADFDDEGNLLALSSHVAFCPEETDAIRRCKLPVTPRGEKPDGN